MPLSSRLSTRTLLIGTGLWTVAVWASRAGLLEADATAFAISRVWVTLALGVLLLIGAARPNHRYTTATMLLYAAWMVVVWIPSLVSVLGGDESLAFQLVHVVLALVSLGSGALVAAQARRQATQTPITTSTQTAAKSAAR